MSVDFVGGVELRTVVCCNCSMTFAMPTQFYDRRRNDRQTFHCPDGHPQHFTGKSEAEKLRDEVERQKSMREAEAARANRLATERDQVAKAHSRMRARVMNGVCPCCNRTFQNLMAHMKTEHSSDLTLGTLRQAFGMTQAAVAEEIGVYAAAISLYERGKPVAVYAKRAIENWVDRHSKARQPKTPQPA